LDTSQFILNEFSKKSQSHSSSSFETDSGLIMEEKFGDAFKSESASEKPKSSGFKFW
jgi:hypothetical protein